MCYFFYAQVYLSTNRVMVFSGVKNKMRNILRNILKNRLALSTVITTLIILVVSVLLAGVVTYFAINVVSTRSQQESLSISDAHMWVTSASVAQGALMITNTGGRDVVINQIQVRGQPCPSSNVFSLVASTSDTGLTAALPYSNAVPAASGNVTGFVATLKATTGNLVLPSGSTLVIYIKSPDSVTINDIGLTVAFTVFTAQAMYYKETNVQAGNSTAT